MLIYLTMIDSPEDQDKFIEIYNHYKDYLQHLALEILHNFDDAEDAVQETFFYVAKNLNKIRESSSPQTTVFLSLVCEHKAIDIIRLKSKNNEVDLEQATYGIVSHYTTGNELADAILKLKAEDREVLFLRFYYGFSISEICKIINKTYAATQRMILRAKNALQDIINEGD